MFLSLCFCVVVFLCCCVFVFGGFQGEGIFWVEGPRLVRVFFRRSFGLGRLVLWGSPSPPVLAPFRPFRAFRALRV